MIRAPGRPLTEGVARDCHVAPLIQQELEATHRVTYLTLRTLHDIDVLRELEPFTRQDALWYQRQARHYLHATKDRRNVIADTRAAYFGTLLNDKIPHPRQQPAHWRDAVRGLAPPIIGAALSPRTTDMDWLASAPTATSMLEYWV